MLEIPVPGFIDMQNVISEYDLEAYSMKNVSIGNDDRIYCLFRNDLYERTKQMFPEPAKYSRYRTISFDVNWYSGEVYGSNFYDFGLSSNYYYHVQPIGESFLLLNAPVKRSFYELYYGDGKRDYHAFVIDGNGNIVRDFSLGKGLSRCIVDSQNNIVRSYCYGPYEYKRLKGLPPACPGVVKWSGAGEKLWEGSEKYEIDECYAMNIDEQDNLWFDYHTFFGGGGFIKTDYLSDTGYQSIKDPKGFLIPKSQAAILFHKDWINNDFCVMEMNNNRPRHSTDAKLVFPGNEIDGGWYSYRSSKAVFESDNKNLFFLDWIYG